MTPRVLPFLAMNLSVALCSGCSGDDDDDNGAAQGTPAMNSACAVTLSGALESTGTCSAHWLQNTQLTDPNPYLGIAAADSTSVFDLFDEAPKVGTFSAGGSFKVTGFAIDMPGVGQHTWNLYENAGFENVGTYTVTITGVSEAGNSSGFHSWNVDGTVDASLPADETSGATGEVQMHIEF